MNPATKAAANLGRYMDSVFTYEMEFSFTVLFIDEALLLPPECVLFSLADIRVIRCSCISVLLVTIHLADLRNHCFHSLVFRGQSSVFVRAENTANAIACRNDVFDKRMRRRRRPFGLSLVLYLKNIMMFVL